MEEGSNGFCCICLEKKHRYTCPRCNVRYCSLTCYKHQLHSNCSELFYRDWFIKEMKERKVTDEEKQAILETIQRVEEENPITDFLDEEVSLEERLADLDINNISEEKIDEIWEKLTSEEQERFKKFVAVDVSIISEELGTAWEPWWTSHNSGLVEEVSVSVDEASRLNLPPVIQVPCFNRLSAEKSPSPLIGFNLVNVLYVYVFFQRLYNGVGTTEFASEFCESCVLSSDVLDKNRTFAKADESVSAGAQRCVEVATQNAFALGTQFPIECIRDVSHVLMGPSIDLSSQYVGCVLSDLHASLVKYRKMLKTDSGSRPSLMGDHAALRKRLFAIIKKLEFFLSWSSSFREQLTLLSIEISELYKTKLQSFKNDIAIKHPVNYTEDKSTKGTEAQLKPKIIELN